MITIIVMLILVSVTISIAVNGGLFGYAGKAAKETEEAKQKELDWLNVGNNLSIDQLIEQYTNERDEDLELIRLVLPYLVPTYTGNDETIINGITTLQNDAANGDYVIIMQESNYIIARYHGKYYKGIGNWTNGFTSADRLNAKELFAIELEDARDNGNVTTVTVGSTTFYKYNNKLYKIIESTDTVFGNEFVEANTEEYGQYLYSILPSNGTQLLSTPFRFYEYNNNIYELKNNTAILLGANDTIAVVYMSTPADYDYIVITPSANQTWTNWANESNGDDLDFGFTTLKQTIRLNSNDLAIDNITNNETVNNYNSNIIKGCIYSVGNPNAIYNN